MVNDPGQLKVLDGVMVPASRPAMAVNGFQVEPGG
jgi:hypothetical protein